jgi:outer membrane receptor protein involved in Fe transport
MAGNAGARGYVFASYEFDNQSGLTLGQRNSDEGIASQNTLLQPQRRHSAFLSAGHEFGDHITVSFDGLASKRLTDSVFQQNSSSTQYIAHTVTPAYGAALSMAADLFGDWKVHLTGVASESRNISHSWTDDDSTRDYSSHTNYVRYGEATADGTLFRLASGDVKVAVGGGYRTEGYHRNRPGSSEYFEGSRDIVYGYGEIRAPLVAPSSARTGLNSLDLSASVRTEHYNDVGESTNPHLGIRYVPIPQLTFRGTWGKSFKAPSFDQLYGQSYLFLWNASTLGYPGSGTALMTNGGNPDLKPERSTSWTIGGEFRPSAVKSLVIGVTYFDINYRDRIVLPVSNPIQFYRNPAFATFILPAPSPAAQSTLIANSTFFYNFTGRAYDPDQVINLLQDSYVNATAQTVRGMDLSVRQSIDLHESRIEFYGNATWLTLRQRTIPLVPEETLTGTIYNPPKFKARGGATWEGGRFTATAFVNYVSGETDTGVTPRARIAPWTTVDANIVYRIPGGRPDAGFRIELAASNLFNQGPPRALSPAIAVAGLDFDSTNSSIIGRVISLTVVKNW